jgi:hypothetical protein
MSGGGGVGGGPGPGVGEGGSPGSSGSGSGVAGGPGGVGGGGSSFGGNVGMGLSGTSPGNTGLGNSYGGELGFGDIGPSGTGASPAPGVAGPSILGGWEQATMQANQDTTQSQQGNRGFNAIDAIIGLVAPPMGLANYGMGMVTGNTIGSSATGDPAGGVGDPGGPDLNFPRQRPPGQSALSNSGPSPFQINPMQVQNDIAGGWGGGQGRGGGQQPRMNPFSMYGTGQPRQEGYNPFSMYGGGK